MEGTVIGGRYRTILLERKKGECTHKRTIIKMVSFATLSNKGIRLGAGMHEQRLPGDVIDSAAVHLHTPVYQAGSGAR